MRKLHEILAVVIFSLVMVLAAAVGFRAYETYRADRQLAAERVEQEQVLARNREANDRVVEMRQEIQELSEDRERLSQFLEEIRTPQEEIIPVSMMMDVQEGMTESRHDLETISVSVSENMTDLSGNMTTLSENTTSMSENVVSVSDNSEEAEQNMTSLSENMTSISDNMISLSENAAALSENTLSSYEETRFVNEEDIAFLAGQEADFSEKKIVCLGDSITAAANLEEQENYPDCSYPSVLQELLGAEEVVNLGIGGSTIGRYWSDPFVERYREIPQDADLIIVMGGTNDGFCLSEKEFGTLAERKPGTFCGDLDELMRGLKEAYPEAEIWFVTPLPNILQDYLMRERSYLLPQSDLVNVMLTLAAEYGIPVIDLYNANLLDSHDADIVAEYMPDGVHANEAGYRVLAQHIAAELLRREQ